MYFVGFMPGLKHAADAFERPVPGAVGGGRGRRAHYCVGDVCRAVYNRVAHATWGGRLLWVRGMLLAPCAQPADTHMINQAVAHQEMGGCTHVGGGQGNIGGACWVLQAI